MARSLALLAVLVATVPPVSVDNVRLLSPSFGYAVTGARAVHVFLNGRDRLATPPLAGRFIEAVDFLDAKHGWVAEYDCGRASVFLFRTTNGGRSWTSLGRPGTHSCGGGPTYLSFVDAQHGWLEPTSPNGPEGYLRHTVNGGKTWKTITRKLPCLAPVHFTSRTVGWIARCGNALYRTRNAGRTWTRALGNRALLPMYDLPRLTGRSGAVATIGNGSVRFYVTDDGGSNWRSSGSRRIFPCADSYPYPSFFPESVVSARTWWVVDQGRVAVTTDAGAHWRVTRAHGLPATACAVRSVSAVNSKLAWAVARARGGNALFTTANGGRTWTRRT
jgi:photosystem II stability/assembly factor-like uncharacterized protein